MGKIGVCVIAVYIDKDAHMENVPISSQLAARHPVVPLRLLTGEGNKIYIDRVTDIQRRASMKAGGLGDRYTCMATFGECQREIYVYKDGDEWFMEEEF